MALVPPPITANAGAGIIARILRARGVDRVFGLCGGHIMPIWMRVDAEGIRIVDVRDESAAVYMAHAHAELTGELGVGEGVNGQARPGLGVDVRLDARAVEVGAAYPRHYFVEAPITR